MCALFKAVLMSNIFIYVYILVRTHLNILVRTHLKFLHTGHTYTHLSICHVYIYISSLAL